MGSVWPEGKHTLATDPHQPTSSLNLVGIKESMPTPCPCSVVMALDGENGRTWLMFLLMVTICMARMTMVLVMVPGLGFLQSWALVGTVGDGGGVIDRAGGWLPLFR